MPEVSREELNCGCGVSRQHVWLLYHIAAYQPFLLPELHSIVVEVGAQNDSVSGPLSLQEPVLSLVLESGS